MTVLFPEMDIEAGKWHIHRQRSSIIEETEESVSPSVTLLRRIASYFRILTAIIICLVLITMLFGTLDSAHFRGLSHEKNLINQHNELQKQKQDQEQGQEQEHSQLQLQQQHDHRDWNEKESAIISYQNAIPNTLDSLDSVKNPQSKLEQSMTSASIGTPISYDITHNGFCSSADICFSSQFHDGVDRQHRPSTKLKNSHHLKLFK